MPLVWYLSPKCRPSRLKIACQMGAVIACAADDRAAPAGLELQVVDRAEQQARVAGEHPVGVAAVDAVGVDEADLRRSRQVVLKARDVEDRAIDAAGRRRRVVDRREQGDVGARAVSRQLDGRQRRRNPPRVDQIVRRGEELGAVQEERALLRKEERAARVERELGGVRLHLREVGVDRAVQRQVRRETPAHVAAELGAARVVVPPIACRDTIRVRGHHRIQIEHQAPVQVGQAVDRSRLREERALGAQGRHPAVLLAAALHAAHDVERPRLHAVGGIAQRLERDGDLDLVAVGGQPPFRLIHVVGREVGDLAAALERAEERAATVVRSLDQRAVGLNPERVGAEDERLPAVVERVQENLDAIVGVDAIAVGERRVHGARSGVRLDAEVDRGRRVEHEDFGLVLGGAAVDGRVLREVGEPHRLLPRRLVQDAVDRDRCGRRVDARNRDVQLVVAPAVDGRGQDE